MPGQQTFIDHLGKRAPSMAATTSSRTGSWCSSRAGSGDPKLDLRDHPLDGARHRPERASSANLGYQFHRKFSVYAGLNGNPGTRSLQGSHPYWLGHDRVMADEFFRPYFAIRRLGAGRGRARPLVQRDARQQQQRARHQGDPARSRPSRRGARCGGCRRRRSSARNGALRRLGASREGRDAVRRLQHAEPRATLQRTPTRRDPDNTTLRLADSVNVFDTGALAPGVTVQTVNYRMLSVDAGHQVQGRLPADARSTTAGSTTSRPTARCRSAASTTRASTCRARSIRCRRSSSSTARRRRSSATRTRASATAPSTSVGMNFYPFNTPRHPAQRAGDRREPLAGQQPFGYYVGGPERHDRRDGVLGVLLRGARHVRRGADSVARRRRERGWRSSRMSLALGVTARPQVATVDTLRSQRLALPPDELHPGRDRTSATSCAIMGTTVGRRRGLRHPAPAAVVVRQHRRLRADLLPADRRAALLLLVHRRLHRDGLPVAAAATSRRASIR